MYIGIVAKKGLVAPHWPEGKLAKGSYTTYPSAYYSLMVTHTFSYSRNCTVCISLS